MTDLEAMRGCLLKFACDAQEFSDALAQTICRLETFRHVLMVPVRCRKIRREAVEEIRAKFAAMMAERFPANYGVEP